jgi:hypothetical protein
MRRALAFADSGTAKAMVADLVPAQLRGTALTAALLFAAFVRDTK